MSNLDGTVAIVTGSATGIGLAIAKRMASEGANVVVADSGVNIAGEDADPSAAAIAAATRPKSAHAGGRGGRGRQVGMCRAGGDP